MQRIIQVHETIFHNNPLCDEKRYYEFELKPAIGPGYREVTSFNCFFHNWRKNYNWTDIRLFYPYMLGRDAPSDWPPKDAKIIQCKDIWDFYQKIGYDYKKKKYLSGEKLRKIQ